MPPGCRSHQPSISFLNLQGNLLDKGKKNVTKLNTNDNYGDKGASRPRIDLPPFNLGRKFINVWNCRIYWKLRMQRKFLLKGLEKLEYRGYDSAGIAVQNEEGVHVFKEKGRIADLRNIVDEMC